MPLVPAGRLRPLADEVAFDGEALGRDGEEAAGIRQILPVRSLKARIVRSGCTSEATAPGGASQMVRKPAAWAPRISELRVSPIMAVPSGDTPSRVSATRKMCGIGLPTTSGRMPAAGGTAPAAGPPPGGNP